MQPIIPYPGPRVEKVEPEGDDDTAMDDSVLSQATEAIDRAVTVNRKFDVPYLGGTSSDGRIVYIDKDLPESFEYDGERCEVDRYLCVHEMVEQALMQGLGLQYQLAHQIALRAERAAVEADGHDWEAYDEFMQEHAERALAKTDPDAPPDLDKKPYYDEKDDLALERMGDPMYSPSPATPAKPPKSDRMKVHRRSKRGFSA